jgi:hypothetical protein
MQRDNTEISFFARILNKLRIDEAADYFPMN